ncbi:Tbingi protein [Trypanosoma theileri]|uniref:Tbingi protein n=1 Tax=Trypanosoma theileri TaxID=67003 RepID=A0A1X0P3Z1_9TRYP|nr:Tbingi protein [Trypanosoma theileri]ORC91289.1 Tbingi protein [Trypanosoma theileri]
MVMTNHCGSLALAPQSIYAWKKAKWSRIRQMSNAQCNKRIKEKMSVHKRERLLTSTIRIATAAGVPSGGRDTAPFWAPELEEIEEKIYSCKLSVSRDRLVARRREMLKQTSHKRWKTLCNNMAVADGCCGNILKRIYAPCPLSTPAIKINNTALT